MKQSKVTFLFFFICSLFLVPSCNKKIAEKKDSKHTIDSVNVFIVKMKNENFNYNTRLKHANKALQKATNQNLDSEIVEIIDYKIYLFANLKQYDSAIYTSKKLLSNSKNDSVYIGNVYATMAYYYNQNNQKDSAYYFYNLIKNKYSKFNDSITNGKNLLSLAIIQSDFGDYNGSDYSATQALEYLSNSTVEYSASIYNCLAINSRNQFDYREALYYYSLALEKSTVNSDKIVINNNIANTYRSLKEYDKSIRILENLRKDTTINHINKARIIDNLAYTKWLENNKAAVLLDLLNALAIRKTENDMYGSIASYSHLSEYYTKLNPELAISHASNMYNAASLQNSPKDKLEALQKLIALSNASKTKEYYNAYVRINDSLQNAEQKAKNKFAKIKYNSEKNREENLRLKIITSAKEVELEKEKNRNLIGGVTSSAVVFGLLIFGYFRKQKYKLEKLQEVYKTETRIAKKIHDEVANDLVNIMNKVQYNEEPKEVLLDNLEKVYLLTRNISHQSNTIETGNKFVDSLKSLLTSFNNDTTTIILKNIQEVKLETMTKDKQIEIYRVLQELMVNMQKHSEASLVAISFKNIKNRYFINYSDNGVGFDNFTLKSGLKNVETRIKSLNGIINFETSLNNGFKAFISFKK
ncbi:MAG: hypothetical protein GZ086_06250 [Gelidibacter sp.]|nr:hypothetical protein [Gelidibacter sp.]